MYYILSTKTKRLFGLNMAVQYGWPWGRGPTLSEVWMCSLYGSKNTILSFSWLHYLEYITVFSISANTSLLNLTHWTSTASLFCVHNRMVGEMTEIHNHPTLRNVCAFCKQGTLKMRQLAQQPQKRMETSSESPPRNGPAPQDTTPSNSSTRYQWIQYRILFPEQMCTDLLVWASPVVLLSHKGVSEFMWCSSMGFKLCWC